MSLFTPEGLQFYDVASGRRMMICTDETRDSAWWVLYRHVEGQWVSYRKATTEDMRVVLKELARVQASTSTSQLQTESFP